MKEACGIAVKVLSKTMDSTNLSSEKSMFPLQLVERVYTFNILILNMLDLFSKLHKVLKIVQKLTTQQLSSLQ